MPVKNLPEDVGTELFAEFHPPLLMAGRTEMAALAGDGKNIFMMKIPALHSAKAVVQLTKMQVAVYDLLEVGPPKSVPTFESLLVDLKKGI